VTGPALTDQEQYWQHNDAYHQRSPGDEESNYHFFRKALAKADLRWNCSILEFGCGTGANLRALKRPFTRPVLTGIEINSEAAKVASQDATVYVASIFDPLPIELEQSEQDLVITKGLMIHLAPNDLPNAYRALVDTTSRYLLVCEYFSPQPRMIPYRGQDDRLWARDFAGEIIDQHGLKLVDYGFVSKLDIHPQDDLTWWLLEKP
jgi:spore coat polysaccharide biosynthesis protein SpsF